LKINLRKKTNSYLVHFLEKVAFFPEDSHKDTKKEKITKKREKGRGKREEGSFCPLAHLSVLS
jgi:hypothetical protein